jgi:uncharacterized repeat protein (TIGR01451 family)/fimbrial isopeptide formation D2 family protein
MIYALRRLAWLLPIAVILFPLTASSQVSELSETLPTESFLGEQFCFTSELTNAGDPGFGPYLRLVLPPLLQFDSASSFGGGTVDFIGEFPVDPDPLVTETELTDPRIDQPVIGPEGFSYYNIILPVGSVVDGGPPLSIDICLTIDPDSEVGVPLPVTLVPVYQFGDTATGANGPIVGNVVEQNVTPTILLFDKSNSAPESERPPGTSWPYTYTLSVDIANTATVNPLTISDTLPPDFQYQAGSVSIAGGASCSVVEEPSSTSPGGILVVECTGNTVGVTGGGDVVVSYAGHIVDVLDELICQTSPIVNEASVAATYIDQSGTLIELTEVFGDSEVTAKHLALQKGASPGQLSPGAIISYDYSVQITDFGDVSNLVFTDVIGDGIDFDDASVTFTVNAGAPITIIPDVTVANDTTVVLDLFSAWQAATGNSQIDAGSSITVNYQGSVRQTYRETDAPVLASDTLTNTVSAAYDLVQGASACSEGSGASVTIVPVSIDKSVVDAQPFYEPGDIVIYRLRMNIPSGDTRGIQFLDFLPLPVLQVQDVDLSFSTNPADCPGSAGICLGPNDTLGLTPTAISASAALNAIQIDWPDVTTSGSQVLEVDLYSTVTDDPFADGLFLTNIFQAFTDNTPGDTAVGIGPVQVQVGAPALELTKGIIDTTGGGAIAPPPGSEFPENGNITQVEAGDEITFRLTVENQGRAPAFEVTLFDDPPAGLVFCTVDDVVSQAGDGLAFSGDLFDSNDPLTLVDALPGLAQPPNGQNVAFVDFTCTVDIGVLPEQQFSNFAVGAYTSQPGGPEFPTIEDDADISVASVELSKSLVASSEAHTDDSANPPRLTIGEIARYRLITQIPRATMPDFTIEDVLPAGLQFLDDGTASLAFVSSSGSGISSSAVAGPGLNIAANDPQLAPGFLIPPSAISPASFSSGTNPVFSLGEVVNQASGSGEEWVVIEFNALVLNIPGNTTGANRDNRFRLQVDGSQLGPDSNNQRIRLVQPAVGITKSASPASGQAGDVVTYQIGLNVASGANNSTAFDVNLTDNLPPAAVLDSGSVAVDLGAACGAVTVNDTSSGNSVLVAFDPGLPPGCNVEVSFQATLDLDVAPGSTVNNTAGLAWSSLPGTGTSPNPTGSTTPGDSGDSDGERVYSGSASAQVTIDSVALSKSAVAGSDPVTVLPSTAIGETVVYELVVSLPFGTTPSVTLRDEVPHDAVGAMELLSAQVLSVGTNLSVANPGGSPVLQNLRLAGLNLNDTVDFDFGSVINDPDTATGAPGENQIVIEVVARLNNLGANASGDALVNLGVVQFGPNLTDSATAVINVVEPALAINKVGDISSGEAGDLVEFSVTINHTAASTANAQNVIFLDDLSLIDDLNYVAGSLSVSGYDVDVIIDDSASVLSVAWPQIPLGESATVSYQATLDDAVQTGTTVTNTAELDWTSLADGSEPQVREYAAANSHEILISAPGINKFVFASSEPSTIDPNLTIGEEVTWRIEVSFPQGLTPMAEFVDLLPSTNDFGYVSSEIVSIGANLGVTGIAEGDPGVFAPGAGTVTWSLGTVDNPPDGAPAQDQQIVFEVVAVVLDEAANQSGDAATNTARLTAATLASPIEDTSTVSLVDPVLSFNKTVSDPASGIVNAGDVVTFQLAINHTGASTADAFSLTMTDTLPAQLNWLGVLGDDCDSVLTVDASAAPVIEFELDSLTLAEGGCTITYQAEVDIAAEVGDSFANSVVAQYDSTSVFVSGETRRRSASTSASVTMEAPALVKVGLMTDLGDTGTGQYDPDLFDLAIGELITYQIDVLVPPGTTSNAVVTDFLPSDILTGVIEADSAQVFPPPGGQLTISQPIGNIIEILDTNGNGFDDTVVFDFDTIVVQPAATTEQRTITLRVTGRVVDVPGNVDGQLLTNLAEFDFLGNPGDPLSDTADLDVVEPALDISKTMTPRGNGEVRIALTVANTGTGPAYGFEVSDVLSDVDWDLSSYEQVSVPTDYELLDDLAGSELTVAFRAVNSSVVLLPGVSRTATFDITLANNPPLPAPDGNNPVLNIANLDFACSFPAGCDEADPGDNIGRTQDPEEDTATLGIPDLVLNKSVALEIDADGSGDISPGDTLRYTLVLENVGAGAATDISITDTPDGNSPLVVGSVTSTEGTIMLGNNPGNSSVQVDVASLGAGDSVTVTYDVTVVNPFPPGVDDLVNQAAASSFELPDREDAEVTPVNAAPILVLVKSDGGGVVAEPGDTLVYTLTFENIGNQDATGVVLTDVVPDNTSFNAAASSTGWSCVPGSASGSLCSLVIGSLPAGTSDSVSFAVDLDNPLPTGFDEIFNIATVADDGNNSPEPVSDSDTETTPVNANPMLSIDKSLVLADPSPVVLGSTLTYAIVASNTGNMTLTNVVISDPLVDPIDLVADCSWDGATGTLLVGESVTCTVEYLVLQTDVDAGGIVNTATTNSDQAGPVSDEETVDIDRMPALALVKSASPGSYESPGDTIEYSFLVENIGNVTLTGVQVDDPMLGGPIACSPSTLAPEDTASCGPVTYTVTQQDVNAGQIVNVATATGLDPEGIPVDSPPDSETVTGPAAAPELILTKSATPETYAEVGDTIEYSFEVANVGNVTISAIEVSDPMLGGIVSCTPSTLDPGEIATCGPVTYIADQDDIDAGEIINVAIASGQDPNGTPVSDEDDATVSGPDAAPSIELVKTITAGSPFENVGDVISYEITATNTGNVTLFDVTISDPAATIDSCAPAQPATLAPTETLVCQASYTVTQTDIDAAVFTNLATVDATDPNDTPVADSDDVIADGPAADPSIELVKTITAGSPYENVGDVISYEITATNTGNVTLFDVEISDADATFDLCTPAQPATLGPGATLVCEVSYTVTQLDIDAGEFTNVASVIGTDPNDDTVTDEDDAVAEGPPAEPALALVKEADTQGPVELGEVIGYTITVTNIGNVTLTSVDVEDSLIDLVCDPATPLELAPGQQTLCSGSYVVTQSDIDAGDDIVNVATTEGLGPNGEGVSDEDDVAVPVVEAAPAIALIKEANTAGPVFTDDLIEYTITVSNVGNVTLTDVEVVDDLIDLVCSPELPAELIPGATIVCTGTYQVQAGDLGGEIVNIATTTGQGPDDTVVDDGDSAVVSTRPPIPVPTGGLVGWILLTLLILLAGLGGASHRLASRPQ